MAAIYLGDTGQVHLERTSNNLPIHVKLEPEDVNVARSRFGIDECANALVSGDRIEIANTDGNDLQLVAGHAFHDWTGYCHIDAAGGIYLYNSYELAINGRHSDALPLVEPTAPQNISVQLDRDRFRCIANIQEYSLTTSRETIDVSSIGEEFRRNYTNGLISGQGTLVCFWDYESTLCEDQSVTYPHYLSQLIIRTKIGGGFQGRFYLNSVQEPYIWYDALCIVTNVAMSFIPSDPIVSTIDFVTTGPIALRMGSPEEALLQEDSSYLLEEDDTSRILLES